MSDTSDTRIQLIHEILVIQLIRVVQVMQVRRVIQVMHLIQERETVY